MEKQKHLSELWESYPRHLTNEYIPSKAYPIGKHLAEILALGPFYYYRIHTSDYSIQHFSNTILSTHGIRELPKTLQQIIDLIHPEDIDFVIAAEKAIMQKMKEIGLQHQLRFKASYCFRMRIADGSYHLFHHQTVHLAKDNDERVTSVLHIHTDIQHITHVNNKVIQLKGIGKRSDCCQIDLSEKNLYMPMLSKREREVLILLAKGLSSSQIGEKLFISEETVRVHRKRLLKKTETTNSSNLIKKMYGTELVASYEDITENKNAK